MGQTKHVKPNEALAHFRAGRLPEAVVACADALAADPRDPVALHVRGLIASAMGQTEAALVDLRASIDAAPAIADFHSNLAAVLGQAGRTREAIASLREAVRLRPDFAEAHNNLGVAYERLEWLAESVLSFRRAIELAPEDAGCHHHLGNALLRLGRCRESADAQRRAISIEPRLAPAHRGLAACLASEGKVDEALIEFRHAADIMAASPVEGQGLLLALHYADGIDPADIFAEHRRWAGRHADPFLDNLIRHTNLPDPERRLRVGYVSADFRAHPVATFIEAAIKGHDRNHFDVCCFSDLLVPDTTTDRLRRAADEWHSVAGLDDAKLADLIRHSRVDILVDLAGHTHHNRLMSFARKPAPIQIAAIGYPDTTGMQAMDYRITDAIADPCGEADRYHTEKLIRLPECAWCYRASDDFEHSSTPSSSRDAAVTFASFNRVLKITRAMIATWSRILNQVPASRLIMLTARGNAGEQYLRESFVSNGIDPARLTILGRPPRPEFIALFGQVDIALDTFPYHGTTTTCDALYMGVPVVTRAGSTHVSRVGVSLLTNVGIPHLIARDENHYVQIAVALANDIRTVRGGRDALRMRLRASPLMDSISYVRHLESAYRTVWHRWCSQPPEVAGR